MRVAVASAANAHFDLGKSPVSSSTTPIFLANANNVPDVSKKSTYKNCLFVVKGDRMRMRVSERRTQWLTNPMYVYVTYRN